MYRLKLAAAAKKELKKIKALYKEAVSNAIDELKDDPFSGKPLEQELTKKFSVRIAYYRILYTINKKDNVVTIVTVGHRSDVYLPKKK